MIFVDILKKSLETNDLVSNLESQSASLGILGSNNQALYTSKTNTNFDYFYYCFLNCHVLNNAISWVIDHANQIELKNFVEINSTWWLSYLVTGNLFLLQFSKNNYSYVPTKNVLIDNNRFIFMGLSNNYEFDAEGNGINNPYKLIHLKNQGLDIGLQYGYSFIQPIMNDVEILMCGAKHNVALLKNGATPSGIVSSKERIDDKTFNLFKSDWLNRFAGSFNAGKLMFLNGGLADYKSTQTSNRDMEYSQLTKTAETSVFKQFKMPLPLIETASQKYANYSEAQAQLYQNMILPLYVDIVDQLQAILKDKSIDIDTEKLPVQATGLLIKLAEQMNLSGVLTINEIREIIGRDPLIGGDIIRSNTTQPIAYSSDEFSDENLFPKDSNE